MYVVHLDGTRPMLKTRMEALDERQKYRVGLFNNFDINEYRSSLPARVNGTCEWVLNNQHYDRWVEEKQASLLWVTGPPGYGKTTLSSYVIDHLDCGKKSTKMDAIVCCFFCVDGIETTKDAKAILRGIIFQILVERPELIKHATRAFDYDTDGTKLFKSYDSLWSLFTEIICDDRLKLVTIVIDAVDECEKAGRNRLMESIARLIERLRHVTSRCVRFCITSRPYVTIMRCFKSYKPQHLMLEEEQTEIDGDLRRVIRERVRKTAEVAHAKQDTIDRWERSLIETADRTFLWTKFILDILDEELLTSPRDFDRILIGIPRDLKATYARFLQKVPPNKEGFAMKLLYVIIASTRPLSLHEINIVISLQEAASTGCRDLASLKKDHLHTNMESDINFVLGPLIRIEKSRVYLAHLSLKEFLCTLIGEYPDKVLSIRYKIDLGVATLFLASACMKYLALEDFSQDLYTVPAVGKGHSSPTSLQSSPIELASPQDVADAEEDSEDDCGMLGNLLQEPEELEAQTCLSLAQKYCLFEYSATNWARHFAQSQNLADDSLKSLALRLSDRTCQHQFENWFRFFWNNCMDQSSSSRKYDQLVIAAFFGHSTSLEAILADNNFDHVESLAIGLYWASRNGNNRSVVMLLTTDVDPNLETVNHQSPLSAAAESGHRDVVKTLLDDGGADINCGAEHDKTPLSMAVGNGHIGIVRLLLPYEHIRVDTEGSKGRTPLYSAISGCHMGIIGILTTDSRVNVNHLDAHDLTPFALAAEEGNEEIVALLLKTPSIDVDHASKDGRTPLCRAAQSGHSAVIKQLKRNGRLKIDHSHKDKTGRNAFGWAALGGHNEVIKLLLRYKLPGIDEEDQHKWTPLFWALEAPMSSTVETLIKSNEINVNHRDHSGRTALSWTVSYGNTTTLRILLDAPDIDPLVPDEQGLTSLDWAWKFEDRSHIADVLEQHVKEKASRSL